MKKYINKMLVALSLFGLGAQVQAYQFTFSNHTGHKIAVGMQLVGINEPIHKLVVEPGRMVTFKEGMEFPLSDSRIRPDQIGYCLGRVFFAKEPEVPYVPVREWGFFETSPKFIEDDQYVQIIVNASKELVQGVTDATAKAASALGELGEPVAAVAGELDLGGLIDSIATLVKISMCRDRHFDIIEDEDGDIRFLTLSK